MNKLNANQVEKLIDLIKKHPVIFDKCDKNYKHTSRKDKIWHDISKAVGADENECKTAWKSLRTQFVKAVQGNKRKSVQNASGKKTYKYYDNLLFLKNSIRTKNRTSNSNDEHHEHEHENGQDHLMEECEVLLYDRCVLESNEVDSIAQIKTSSSPRSTPPPKSPSNINYNSSDHEHLKKILDAILTEIKSANEIKTKKDDIQTYFVVIANMVRNANMTRFQSRQMQRKIFNFVSEELDKLDYEA